MWQITTSEGTSSAVNIVDIAIEVLVTACPQGPGPWAPPLGLKAWGGHAVTNLKHQSTLVTSLIPLPPFITCRAGYEFINFGHMQGNTHTNCRFTEVLRCGLEYENKIVILRHYR